MNLIALPANIKAQRLTPHLPVHNTNHPEYSEHAFVEVWDQWTMFGGSLNPQIARAVLETSANTMRARIMERRYHPTMR